MSHARPRTYSVRAPLVPAASKTVQHHHIIPKHTTPKPPAVVAQEVKTLERKLRESEKEIERLKTQLEFVLGEWKKSKQREIHEACRSDVSEAVKGLLPNDGLRGGPLGSHFFQPLPPNFFAQGAPDGT